MKKVITNTTNSPMYVMGRMVPPGEMVAVEVAGGPVEPPAPAQPTLAEQVAELLKNPVAVLIADLPGLSGDALDMLAAQEGAAKRPRTTLLTAIADEVIARADAKLKGEDLSEGGEGDADAGGGEGKGAADGGAGTGGATTNAAPPA